VTKLFNIVKPHIAVFGQKDAQQCIIIKKMIQDLNFDIKMIISPIIREPDGLAMSSRNKYLSPKQRKQATKIYSTLSLAKESIQIGETNSVSIKNLIKNHLQQIEDAKIDYVEIVNTDNLDLLDIIDSNTLIAVAVYIGNTRLIDNVIIN
jgi:pantoate--beta-alanine ligase